MNVSILLLNTPIVFHWTGIDKERVETGIKCVDALVKICADLLGKFADPSDSNYTVLAQVDQQHNKTLQAILANVTTPTSTIESSGNTTSTENNNNNTPNGVAVWRDYVNSVINQYLYLEVIQISENRLNTALNQSDIHWAEQQQQQMDRYLGILANETLNSSPIFNSFMETFDLYNGMLRFVNVNV